MYASPAILILISLRPNHSPRRLALPCLALSRARISLIAFWAADDDGVTEMMVMERTPNFSLSLSHFLKFSEKKRRCNSTRQTSLKSNYRGKKDEKNWKREQEEKVKNMNAFISSVR